MISEALSDFRENCQFKSDRNFWYSCNLGKCWEHILKSWTQNLKKISRKIKIYEQNL